MACSINSIGFQYSRIELAVWRICPLPSRLLDEAVPGAPGSGRYAIYADVYRTGIRRELIFYHAQVEKWLRIVVVKVACGFCISSADVSA